MTNKENALKVIRHIQDTVEGLKELSRGCKVMLNKATIQKRRGWLAVDSGYEYELIDSLNPVGDFKVIGIPYLIDKEDIVEIIGHEPELRHLLLAIQAVKPDSYAVMTDGMIYSISGKDCDYEDVIIDLTKSLLANLEDNPQLTNYLLTLFGL